MSKKNDSPKLRSFAKRLTRRINLAQFIVLLSFSLVLFTISCILMSLVTIDFYKGVQQGMTERIRRVLSDVHVGSINHERQIEEALDQPDKLYDIMAEIVEKNPRIRSCGLSFRADYYPQKGHWFCPYAYRADSTTVATSDSGGEDNDYLTAKWFTEAMAGDSTTWSKPFYSSRDTISPLVSFLMPIHDKQGQTVAILSADLSLDFLHSITSGLLKKMFDNTFIGVNDLFTFIIDRDGDYIDHPDHKLILNDGFAKYAKSTPDTLDDHVVSQMLAGKSGFSISSKNGHHLVINNERSFFFYMPIPHIYWSMGLAVPTYAIYLASIVFAVFLLFFIIVAVIVVFLVGHSSINQAVQPLKILALSADEVAKGHFDTPLPYIKYNDEVRQLRDSFEQMQQSLTKYVDELKETTASKASIERELTIASAIQRAMLPKTFPPYPDCKDIDICGLLKPAKAVGGDLFDFCIRDEHLFFCIGDVSGKGVPASLVMAVTRSLFRNVSSHIDKPDIIVRALNDALSESNDTNMFVTLFVGVLDMKTGKMRYCNAGHNAPILIGRDVDPLPCDPNLPIGVMPDMDFSLQETNIDPQTTIFLFTDGLNEAEDIGHKQFGQERINNVAMNMLNKKQHQPEMLIDAMTKAVHAFVGEAEQSDDLTMMAIQYLSNIQ